MARASFGGGVADFVISAAAAGDPLRFAAATLTFWDAETAGTQLDDLLLNDVAVTSIRVSSDGQVPTFQGPDDVLLMWAQAGSSGARVQMVAAGDIVTRANTAVTQAETAAADAIEAKEAAEAVGTTNDTIMTAVAANPASAFAAQQSASIEVQVEPVQTQLTLVTNTTPTVEEISPITVPLATGSPGTITAATTIPIHTAMFGCTIEQFSIAVPVAVTASDSNYWTAKLVSYRAGVASNIAVKTTKTVASGGEGMAAMVDWNFDTVFWGGARQLVKGDVLALVLTPTGSPTALTLPAATFRIQPDDGTALPLLPVAWDTFTRADSATTLGTSTSGHAWSVLTGSGVVFGISSNKAYRVDSNAARGYAVVDTGFSDGRVSVDLATIGAATYPSVCFRMVDGSPGPSGFTLDQQNLYRIATSGALTSLATFPLLAPSDNVAICGFRSWIWVEVNDVAVTAPVSDTQNQTSTLHGIRVSTATGSTAHRLDGWECAA